MPGTRGQTVYQHTRRRVVPHYFAPEVIECKRHGKGSDWYSFGALLYELLTGYTPFIDASGAPQPCSAPLYCPAPGFPRGLACPVGCPSPLREGHGVSD